MKDMAKGLVVLAALCFGQQAMAVDAPELKVEHSIIINATPEQVWAVAGDFVGLNRWLPVIPESRLILGKNNQVGAIRELSNGRVVVADPRDKILQAIDFRSGSSVTIGREGSGPAEFGMPMRVFTAPNDTTLLFDPLNNRYLVVGPDAKPVTSFRVETPPPANAGGPGGGMMMMGGGFSARAADARGRLYGEGSPMSVGADGRPQRADSAVLLRYDRVTQKTDTLGYIKLAKANIQTSGSQGNMNVRIGGANPLAPRDEWTVFPDGRVAIVRAADYRVDWIQANGTKSSTAAIRYTPIQMTAADRREEEALRLRNRSNQMMVSMTIDNGQTRRTAQMGGGANQPPPEPLTDWPEVKPPFRPGLASVLARSNGELWIQRTEPAGAKGALYDVLNAAGVVTHQMRVQDGWRLVGFGNGTVYTTKTDADDLVYLQRHRF